MLFLTDSPVDMPVTQ